jgi:glycosyltransferase involved in cell wall biosynthesis
MKVLHLSTSDLEGGAARAAYRIHQGMQAENIDSQMLVRAKLSADEAVITQKSLLTKLGPPSSGLPLRRYRERDRAMFSTQWFIDALAPEVKQIDPDIVHLHWICNGFLQIETLAKLNKPLVWTMHDMWAFTGGCHYAGDCDRYTKSCGACPHLKSTNERDLSYSTWQRKAKAWSHLNLTIVSPSSWLAQCAHRSPLFERANIKVIPHGLDLKKYQQIEKQIARSLLHLPQDKQLILFGAVTGTGDRRKGFDLLKAALQALKQSGWQDKTELVVVGGVNANHLADLGYPVRCLGQFTDDIALSIAYSAADVTVVPSVQEAFGQMASESLACGTPAVAFNATGLMDIIDHQQNGYLAAPFAVQDLARGIAWVLEDGERHQQLCQDARQKAEQEFSLELQAKRYLSLFNEILHENCHCEYSIDIQENSKAIKLLSKIPS